MIQSTKTSAGLVCLVDGYHHERKSVRLTTTGAVGMCTVLVVDIVIAVVRWEMLGWGMGGVDISRRMMFGEEQ